MVRRYRMLPVSLSFSYARRVGRGWTWVVAKAITIIPHREDSMRSFAIASTCAALAIAVASWCACAQVLNPELQELDVANPRPLGKDAEKYLADAASIIQEKALYADRVDWHSAMARARMVANGAQTPAQSYGAIRYLLRSLADRHSFLIDPDRNRAIKSDVATDDPRVSVSLLDRVGYVRVPGFAPINHSRGKAFAHEASERSSQWRPRNPVDGSWTCVRIRAATWIPCSAGSRPCWAPAISATSFIETAASHGRSNASISGRARNNRNRTIRRSRRPPSRRS